MRKAVRALSVSALFALATFSSALVASSAMAAPPKAPAAPAPAKKKPVDETAPSFAMSADIEQKLRSSDESTAKTALEDLRLAGKAAAPAAPVVIDVLKKGATALVAENAIDALADMEAVQGAEVIVKYATHRNARVRRASVRALSKMRGVASVATLRRALGDPDPQVRGFAATGLGNLDAKDAVTDLFLALDHRISESAASIGRLCAQKDCDRFLALVGKFPFDVMSGGLDVILFRNDIDEDSKIKVVGTIRELGTIEANKFLKDVQGRWPAKWSKRVKQSLDQAVLATAGASQ